MKNPKDFLLETYARVKQDTPKYWLQVRIFWAYVTAIAAVVVSLNVAEIDLLSKVMPKAIAARVADISKYAAAIGLISMLQTKLAVKSPLLHKDPEISTK